MEIASSDMLLKKEIHAWTQPANEAAMVSLGQLDFWFCSCDLGLSFQRLLHFQGWRVRVPDVHPPEGGSQYFGETSSTKQTLFRFPLSEIVKYLNLV